MDLNTLWFVLIAVLFTGFFVLEGFDYGVGILLPFVAKTDAERRRVINTIGPVWDGNEVWILTGGGAIFAAFPHWYATLFSGFYLALFLILAALIVRGVAFEFRSKDKQPGLARDLGLDDLRRQPAARAAVGRGARQPAEGRADRRVEELRRRLLRPALALHAHRRARLAQPVRHPRRDLPEPEEHRSDPRARARGDQEDRPGGDGAAAAVRGGHLSLDRRLRAPGRQPGSRAARWRSGRC